MQIVNPNDSEIRINYFNRYDAIPVVVSLYNESTRITENLSFNGLCSDVYYDYLTVTNADTFKEDEDYFLKIVDASGRILFQDKIFATSQENYSVNNGEYTERAKENEYVIYE